MTFFPDIVSGPMVVSGIYTRHLSLLVEYNDEGQCRVVAQVNAPPGNPDSGSTWAMVGRDHATGRAPVERHRRGHDRQHGVADSFSGLYGNQLVLMDDLGNTASTSQRWPYWPEGDGNPNYNLESFFEFFGPGQDEYYGASGYDRFEGSVSFLATYSEIPGDLLARTTDPDGISPTDADVKEFWDLTQASDGTVTDQAQGTSLTATNPADPFYGMTIDVPDYSIQFAEPVTTVDEDQGLFPVTDDDDSPDQVSEITETGREVGIQAVSGDPDFALGGPPYDLYTPAEPLSIPARSDGVVMSRDGSVLLSAEQLAAGTWELVTRTDGEITARVELPPNVRPTGFDTAGAMEYSGCFLCSGSRTTVGRRSSGSRTTIPRFPITQTTCLACRRAGSTA